MRKLFTNNRLAVAMSAAMLLSVAPLGAQVRHTGASLPSRTVGRPDFDHRHDSREWPGKGKAKGKYKHDRDRYVVIDGRLCQVKETKNGDRAMYKCRRQDDRTYEHRADQRDRDDDRRIDRGDGWPARGGDDRARRGDASSNDQVYRDACGVLSRAVCRVERGRTPRAEPTSGAVSSRAAELWGLLR